MADTNIEQDAGGVKTLIVCSFKSPVRKPYKYFLGSVMKRTLSKFLSSACIMF